MEYKIKLIRKIVIFLLVLFVTFFLVTLSLLMVVLPSIIKSMQNLGKLDLTPIGRTVFDYFFYFLFATSGALFFFLLTLIIYSYTLNNSNLNLPSNTINPTTRTVLNPSMVSPILHRTMMVRTIDNSYSQPFSGSSVISLPKPPMFKYKPTMNVSGQRISLPPPPRSQFITPPLPPRPTPPINRSTTPINRPTPPINRSTTPINRPTPPINRPTPPINRPTPPPIQRVTSPSTGLPAAIHSLENSRPSGNPSRPLANSSRPLANSSRSPENSRSMNSGANSQSSISVPSTLGMNRTIQPTSQPMNQVPNK